MSSFPYGEPIKMVFRNLDLKLIIQPDFMSNS